MQHAVVSDWFKIVLSCSIFKYELDSKEGLSCLNLTEMLVYILWLEIRLA